MPAAPNRSFPCPKCGRTLRQSGEVTTANQTLPTFQCDECLMTVDFAGQKIEVALTFCLDPEGRPFDPADPEGKLRI